MRRRGFQVGHSVNMFTELPHYAYDPDVPTALRAAAFDAFFMHLRLPDRFPDHEAAQVAGLRKSAGWDYVHASFTWTNPSASACRLRVSSPAFTLPATTLTRCHEPQSPVSFAPARSELDAHRDDVFAAMAVIS